MPRNGGGTFVLAESAFSPGTPISSAAMNSDLSDIGDGITDSLARDGQGGMTAVLPLANTGFTYLSDPNTGMRRTGADTQAIQCGSVDTVTVTSTGASVAGTLAVSGAITSGGAPLIPVGAIWAWPGLTAPSKWLLFNGQTLLRATYPDLWAFAAIEIAAGNLLFTNGNGSTTFTVGNANGRVLAGRDPTGTILNSTTMTPDGNTMGAIGGAQNSQLSTANLPPYTPSGTIVGSISSSPNTIQIGGGSHITPAGGGATSVPATNEQTLSFSASGLSFNGSAQGGTSTAFTNVQPTIIVNYIIYAGV